MIFFFGFWCVITLALPVLGSQGGFRGQAAHAGFQQLAELAAFKLESGEVRAKLQEMLDNILSVGSASIHGSSNLQRVEQLIATTFQAMPKTSAKRLGPQAVRHVLHSYFVKQHGWSLFGLQDLFAANNTEMSPGQVPALMEAVLEAREHSRGLTISEVAGLVAAMERLILDESVQWLRWAYMMNALDESTDISETETNEVLLSYLLLFKKRKKNVAAINDPEGHAGWKTKKRRIGELDREEEFVHDAIANFDFRRRDSSNPFAMKLFSFAEIEQIADDMAQQFGSFQDHSCKVLRQALEPLEVVAGSGRVPLADFWKLDEVARFVLTETKEELRLMGALDEGNPDKPTVRIANYIISINNCEHYSEYFDACCLNTCDSIMGELEGLFRAPMAEPERLLAAVANISAAADKDFDIAPSPVLGPAGEHMRQSLRAIAQRHDGMVPLQSRNFATWLHFAFPRDCPLPLKQAPAAEMSVEAMKEIAPQEWASDMEYHMPAETAWAAEDDVPLLQDLQIAKNSFLSKFRGPLRLAAMTGAAFAIVSIGMQHFKAMASAMQPNGQSKKHDDFQLPLRF